MINKINKTFSLNPSQIDRQWILIDATDAPVGRIATKIATYLTGKYKSNYTPHVDNGDYVIVINSKKSYFTGNKELAKTYYTHSGYPGGIKSKSASEMREKFPNRIIEKAVKGMLPKNKLSDERIKRLKIYSGANHMHEAQKPKKVEIG